ncbi:MAG: hypothetical protein A3C30_00105 [Candidatus Levybacteria bacterium RIFCSPHIGHO2_02_FULL_40_18]|nr:MAG: hypothetical protein A2869_03800 [Candidatus Levybacteria bacterium RIFCSPHIGHO2_01_FULL_40_58]OGH27106.1 MAG: hypothetical protein A3C30_00105 [Candidatus Levybacteria bacterium RIFCSPHIGHO2_02_FULL_40_18]OGH30965.1 MAG: hypothetical protein A3E43_04520 [Candidatus Levybacteria bacterium RIFCSPHIGHO2_12_FULL_40_31]OGH40976.1 MAG: hypothetical protein A2894_01735 [Candidatus Levybacteria bacterium RIFCSPLOWO2_01_FULL_40_64]OGH48947.1 MAG: hypothetical protein A3I54_02820 [Candidatus Lev
MNDEFIKKLAKITIRNGRIDKRIIKYVLSNLSRKELIVYLAALKKSVYENSVRVISSQKLSDKAKKSIRAKLKDRTVFFEQDKSLGAGLKIILDDSIIDLTFSGYITRVLEQLKA